ncbi:unnamed protein product, partial [Hapterophycus canaliculatus]
QLPVKQPGGFEYLRGAKTGVVTTKPQSGRKRKGTASSVAARVRTTREPVPCCVCTWRQVRRKKTSWGFERREAFREHGGSRSKHATQMCTGFRPDNVKV